MTGSADPAWTMNAAKHETPPEPAVVLVTLTAPPPLAPGEARALLRVLLKAEAARSLPRAG